MSGYIAEAILSISSRVVVFYLVPTIEIAENITRGWERGRGGGGGGGEWSYIFVWKVQNVAVQGENP